MSLMCETCKCTTGLEGGCDNGCPCCNQPGEEIVWQSKITGSMVADFTLDEIYLLITDLNDAVQQTCQDYGMAD